MDFRTALINVDDALTHAGIEASVPAIIALTDRLMKYKVNFNEQHADYSTHEGRVLAALSNPEVMMYMRETKRINAIKALRAATGCGLKEAKDAIEDDRVTDTAGIPRVHRY